MYVLKLFPYSLDFSLSAPTCEAKERTQKVEMNTRTKKKKKEEGKKE